MLLIKCGMLDEEKLAQELFPQALVIKGIRTVWWLDRNVPKEVDAAVSFGVAGGLSPDAQIAQVFQAFNLITDRKTHEINTPWRQRVFAKTKVYTQPWFSTGDFDLADNPKQRAKLFRQTGAWCIDDESCGVAEFAELRGIPFLIFRSISDGWLDVVPSMCKAALDPDGGYNVAALAAAIVKHPNFAQFSLLPLAQMVDAAEQAAQIARMADQYGRALAALRHFGQMLAPDFCWRIEK